MTNQGQTRWQDVSCSYYAVDYQRHFWHTTKRARPMNTTSSQLKLPPGPKGLPFFGSAFAFQGDPLRFVRRLQGEYGSMATAYVGKLPFVFCFRPEHVRY